MTRNYHPKNERIKWNYFRYLREADGKADSTINGVRKSLTRFEKFTNFRDFATFNKEQAVGFKRHLASLKAIRSNRPLSRATMLTTLNNVRSFFKWLAYQQGYKSRICLLETDYFKMSEKDVRAAKAPRLKASPTPEQIRTVIAAMPCTTDIEKRNRALIAFIYLTGIRDGALISLKLSHIKLDRNLVIQHPEEVTTKFSKYIETYFFPVGDDIREIVIDWVRYLKEVRLYGNHAPLFPRSKVGQDDNFGFEVQGLEPVHWQTTSPVRAVFKEAFQAAGIAYFHPHLFRNTLTQIGEKICKTPEQFKAWSQNFGHESPLTTFISYGHVPSHRQGELIEGLGKPNEEEDKLSTILEVLRKQ